jgi:hypothetical protein
MKKLFLFISAALLLSACTAPPTNREATNSSSSTNKASETKATAAVTEAEVTAKEKEIWATLEKKDYTAFGSMLADDFIYVTGDGVHDKADTVKIINGFSVTDVVFSDWKFIPVGKSAAVLTFSVKAKASMNGEALPPTSSRDTSVWVNRGGKLVAVYHQDTTVATTTAPPPPPQKSGSPAASPAASFSPATLSSDVEANEKAVWAAFAAKQWDTFGSYLATDFVEVETDGVYDRAGSIKGVQGFDFSKAALSGWKTVKIDDESGLVTYTQKSPGMKPDTYYHSSVWSMRGGKWLAVFHQGTPMAPPAPAPKSTAKKTP